MAPPTDAPGTLVVVRHGETEWSAAGRHTSQTDLPLLPAGRERARALSAVLDPALFDRVLCSPLLRARETCALAGFDDARVEITEDLREWDYGEYEGLTTPQIRERRPGWSLWSDGCPQGETPVMVGQRADHLIDGLGEGSAIAFAHGHILRVVAARWIGLGPEAGALLALSPATVSVLGHERDQRVIEAWNQRFRR